MELTYTCQSEYGFLESVFLKNVKEAFIDDHSIKEQWKELNYLGQPNLAISKEEYDGFEKILKKQGATLQYFPTHHKTGMDSMYCRDASIATDAGMILCNMGKKQRQGEPKAAKETFLAKDVPIFGVIEGSGMVEGGDVAWLDTTTLAVGHGYRTNQAGIDQLRDLLNTISVELIQVELPHYKGPSDVFHLMSMLSPVDKNLAVVYSPFMTVKFRNNLLQRGYDLVEVPDNEFESMGCNVLAIAPRVCVMVKGNPITKSRLEAAGCTVYEYEGNDISVKGGGGPTCLTRPIGRYVEL